MPDSAYVAVTHSNAIEVVDTSTLTVITTLTVGNDPLDVTVTSDRKFVYFTNTGDGTVGKIDATTNTVLATAIPVGSPSVGGDGACSIAITPDNKTLVVPNFVDGTVYFIDTATDTVLGILTLPIPVTTPPALSYGAYSVCISADGKTAWLAGQIRTGSSSGSYVNRVDIASRTNLVTISLLTTNSTAGLLSFRSIAITPDQSHVFVTGRLSGFNSVIDTSTNTVVASMPDLTGEPTAIMVMPDSSRGWWADTGGRVTPFNITTFAVGTPTNLSGSNSDTLTGLAALSDSTEFFVSDAGPSPSRNDAILWKLNNLAVPSLISSVNFGAGLFYAAGIGLSYYPVPPPVGLVVPKLYIPIKGKISSEYSDADITTDLLAIERWANSWIPVGSTLFFPTKPPPRTTDDMEGDWLTFTIWANDIAVPYVESFSEPAPTFYLPRHRSLASADLNVDWLAIQNWANSLG